GSMPWLTATWARLHHQVHYDQIDELTETLRFVRQLEPSAHELSTITFLLGSGAFMLDLMGRYDVAAENLARVDEHLVPVAETNTSARAYLGMLRGYRAALMNDDPWTGLMESEASRAGYAEANHRRMILLSQVFAGMNCWLLGAFERAERELRGTLGEDFGL